MPDWLSHPKWVLAAALVIARIAVEFIGRALLVALVLMAAAATLSAFINH